MKVVNPDDKVVFLKQMEFKCKQGKTKAIYK